MIAKLSGILDSVETDACVVDVGGVGYLAYCSGRTLGRLPPLGQPVSLAVITHVREDHIHLYGFLDAAEREWFRLLTTVQGVGSRVALAIQTVLGPSELAAAIALQDKAALARADGVGPKLAARIANELRDKTTGLAAIVPLDGDRGTAPAVPRVAGAAEDAVSALVNLGYRRIEAFAAVAGVQRRLGVDAPIEALIRGGLAELAQ
ncbi:Holliday junction DNA helicase subunit RuvA [Stella humosa]|uniref:Holliday junction branch migration complex subunit RuvA n=1 Tax=Stella humosa TaxID=94 RepID=A0A3N1LIE3_9PROT|nr:Holliday junction branch migration protein RuvA [Stella humosa]ROP91297.1 Holliday junction DNA helicase subunit RuvA [Stella humosa]BBK34348.1 Holliday junction ATP-dependent DNA helicase RuvA [Stella humosa]